jgi:hypothetical protein
MALLIPAVLSLAPVLKAQEQQAPGAQAQPAAPQDPASAAEAARRSKAEKDKPRARRVYTDEDMSSLTGPVSVVGEEKSKPAPPDEKNSSAKLPATGEPKPVKRDEAYWRGRAQALHQQMDAVDKQIADLQEEIKKYGNGGASADPRIPLYSDVIYMNDRRSRLKDLEKKKADLEKQMDQLQDEARKAGVDPGWVR